MPQFLSFHTACSLLTIASMAQFQRSIESGPPYFIAKKGMDLHRSGFCPEIRGCRVESRVSCSHAAIALGWIPRKVIALAAMAGVRLSKALKMSASKR